MRALHDPETEVLFNLDGVDVWDGLSRATSGRGRATDWELLQIYQNRDLWNQVRGILNGIEVGNPFD
ncbi:hypothetical protein Pla110_09640 [Polystyrenella longa]|uniref:Uncharacterized protein n=1 Tax=Polystyrenella longa TaxID=2528007 RepID=A0A518CJ56_9PLAN|nr:hypothetical protein [Polystyrenella longa]QDU79258.1 hypothetical protein Pla110_09640 [Polystyrenella longa]